MSRRNNVTDPADGQIKLKCPRGHDAGAILVVGPRRPIGGPKTLYRLRDVLKAPKIEERPDGKLESVENFVHEGRMEWGKTVEAECEKCGRQYWTFFETVQAAIDKTADTPVVALTLDNDPLC